METGAARAVFGEVKVVRADSPETPAPHAETTIFIGPDEPAFDGHYPGFPILPGVCLIECVHRSALATFPAVAGDATAAPRLSTVETARFLDPVFPGETVMISLTWAAVEDGWRCRGVVRNPRGDSARIRLRYVIGER